MFWWKHVLYFINWNKSEIPYTAFVQSAEHLLWCLVHAHAVWGADCHSILDLLLGKYSLQEGIRFLLLIENYHKISSLKYHTCIILHVCRLEVQHSSHWATIKVLAGLCSLLGCLEENCSSGLSQLPETTHIPWLLDLFLHLQRQLLVNSFSHHWHFLWSHISFSDLLLLSLSSSFKDSCHYILPTKIVQDNHSIWQFSNWIPCRRLPSLSMYCNIFTSSYLEGHYSASHSHGYRYVPPILGTTASYMILIANYLFLHNNYNIWW